MNKVEPYDPRFDANAVLSLWERSLGAAYPISDRVFWQNTSGNPGYEPGDALVIRCGKELLGFCLTQVPRTTGREQPLSEGSITVLLVDHQHRRQGLGTQLLVAAEDSLRRQGLTQATIARGTDYRFWPGIPMDLEPARAFFAAREYEMSRGIFDMLRDLQDYEHPARVRETRDRERVVIEPVRDDGVGELLAFERLVFPGWERTMRIVSAAGDTDHLIVVRDGGRIIGSLQTFSPLSRYRGANVVWERLLGAQVGGLGAVGIAPSARGRGLGLALVAVASELLQARGVGPCVIDWTEFVDLYTKLDYQPWREYWMAAKKLV